MPELLVLTFESETLADEVLLSIAKSRREYRSDFEEAAVVIRDSEGKVKIRQSFSLVAYSAGNGMIHGGIWGVIFGTLFLVPAMGWSAGTVPREVADHARAILAGAGIHDDFIHQVGMALKPGSSALFTLVCRASIEQVLHESEQFNGTVLRTSLAEHAEMQFNRGIEKNNHDRAS